MNHNLLKQNLDSLSKYDLDFILNLSLKLISFKSTEFKEKEIVDYIESIFTTLAANVDLKNSLLVERISVDQAYPGRDNLFITCGEPKIVFTTHVDVVPANEEQFDGKIVGEKLIGRGACDTKSIIAVMIHTFITLLINGERDFGLLFVVGEETTGDGAKLAREVLNKRGIAYLINGEPTENKLVRGHKGLIVFQAEAMGVAAHSAYPELGLDANEKLIRFLHELYSFDWPSSSEVGKTTVNAGIIKAGKAHNVVSEFAFSEICIRTAVDNSIIFDCINQIAGNKIDIKVLLEYSPTTLFAPNEFETINVSYGTDVPNFIGKKGETPLSENFMMYGPGSINTAHSDHEEIVIDDLKRAYEDYIKIFNQLKQR